MSTNASFTLRKVKSFVLRKGRITTSQQTALQTLWPKYGVDYRDNKLLNLATIFTKKAPIVLEIGFGNGQTLVQTAKQYPELNFIGIEVYQTGIARLLMDIHREQLSNIRIIQGDAIDILCDYIPNSSISTVQVFFPDPWPKARHHKRRLVQPNFITLISNKLIKKGIFHFTTDWADYARHTLEIMESNMEFVRIDNNIKNIDTLVLARNTTKFEQRGRLLGHNIYEFIFQRY
jgi:tRNA (guanine-N7-)-methyltransferase